MKRSRDLAARKSRRTDTNKPNRYAPDQTSWGANNQRHLLPHEVDEDLAGVSLATINERSYWRAIGELAQLDELAPEVELNAAGGDAW